jgi:homoserine kinase
MPDRVTAFAPATVANVGPGFDVLGFAIEGLGDRVTAARRGGRGVVLAGVEGDGGVLPRDAARNTAGVAARALLEAVGAGELGFELSLAKGMPLASGLGSSAASAAAAVTAVNALLQRPAGAGVLLRAAAEGERAACGTAHADNVAPSLFGGFVLVRDGASPRVDALPVPAGLTCALLHPHQEVRTANARALLPARVPRATAVEQAGNVAAFVAGLVQGDLELLRSAIRDVIAEPVRKGLVHGFEEVRAAALSAGALGCGLAGSGPSLFALCASRERAEDVVAAMARALAGATGDAGDTWISPVGARGAHLVEDRA